MFTFWGDFLKGKSCQNTPKNANITFYIRYIKELGTYLPKFRKIGSFISWSERDVCSENWSPFSKIGFLGNYLDLNILIF